MSAPYRPYEPRWTGPGVECATCGVDQTPVPVTMRSLMFWTIPIHRAFSGFAPGWCGGSGRLIGPVL